MEEIDALRISILTRDAFGANSPNLSCVSNQPRNYFRWLKVGVYAFFVLTGQSVAMLLGRSYYKNGGNSQWMGTLVQLAGFPILLPYYFFSGDRRSENKNFPKLGVVCSFLGIGLTLECFLYSAGLKLLPVSTYSLIAATQLAFNAFFSFFLNAQKFTPYILNSLVLLTISSVLIVFQAGSESGEEGSKRNYAIGFICTVSASALNGLILSLTQFSIKRVLKRESFSVVMDITVMEALLATCLAVLGLFGSGEWKGLRAEMNGFKLGKACYVMTLTGTAISWQAFFVGSVGLILEVSSLFSNSISVSGLPIVPVLAVIFFHEKMNGIKIMALIIAIWGFVSYAYQKYLDSYGDKAENGAEIGKPELLYRNIS